MPINHKIHKSYLFIMNVDQIFLLQVKQKFHDEKYHQDVLALTLQNRIKHIVLHFSKYIGKLFEEIEQQKIYIDMMICCLALANALNIKLESYHMNINNDKEDDVYKKIVMTIGKMAKACESLDHIESFPSRDILVKEVKGLFNLVLKTLSNLDIEKMLIDRWSQVESRNIFNIQTYIIPEVKLP